MSFSWSLGVRVAHSRFRCFNAANVAADLGASVRPDHEASEDPSPFADRPATNEFLNLHDALADAMHALMKKRLSVSRPLELKTVSQM